jgi:hypothetical protein
MAKPDFISFPDGEETEVYSFKKMPDGTVHCAMGNSKEQTEGSDPSNRVKPSLESVWASIKTDPFPREPVEIGHLTTRHGALKHLSAVISHDFTVMIDNSLLTNSKFKKLGQTYLSHRAALVKLIKEFDEIEGLND